MLSERPDVRVHGDPAIHVPGEGIRHRRTRPSSAVACYGGWKTPGCPFWGVTLFWARKKGVQIALLPEADLAKVKKAMAGTYSKFIDNCAAKGLEKEGKRVLEELKKLLAENNLEVPF